MADITGQEELLNTLSPQEREIALRALNDLSNGDDKLYNDLRYAEYKEVPVGILTFLDDDRYLGKAWHDAEGNSKLYPYWRKRIVELFPDNLTTNYNNVIFSGSRGLGKSEMAVAICCYEIYRVLCLRNPREYFGLKPTETITVAFMNLTLEAAQEIAISKFQNTIQMSPWFLEHGTLSGRTNIVWNPPEYMNIIIGSQSSDLIGRAVYFCFLDEISFLRNKDIEKQKEMAMDMINTAIGGMKTRFVRNGINYSTLVLASSKRSDKSFLETYMKKQVEINKGNLMLVDEAIWNVKPKGTYNEKTFRVGVGNKFLLSKILEDYEAAQPYIDKGYKILDVPIDFKNDFQTDIDRALCDFAGISSTELSKYISGEAWAETRDDSLKNPFVKEIIEVGEGDSGQYRDFFEMDRVDRKMMRRPMYIHMDMSVSGDKTGIVGVWIKSKEMSREGRDASDDLTFQMAFAVSIKAPRGRQISFDKHRKFLYWLKDMGFKIAGVSTDGFQSTEMKQALEAHGYDYTMISVDRVDKAKEDSYVCRPYQYFRSCIYEHRLVTFYDEELTEEVTDLERNINTGRIDHPEGSRKDCVDALTGAIYNASQHAEQFAYDFGETLTETLKANVTDQTTSSREQINIAFEQELQNMFTPQPIKKMHDKDVEKKEQLGRGDYSPPIAVDGMLIW